MGILKERLGQDLKASMKARETLAVETLRMLLSAIKYEEVSKKSELTAEEEVAVLRRAVKSRQDSVALFEKGGRQELADKERLEIVLIERHLPTQLSEEDLGRVIEELIRELGASSKKDLGRLMKELMARHPGKVDGRIASKLLASRLV